MSSNLHYHEHKISSSLKSKRYGHKPAVIWLTGLSGSGKSTIANLLETKLFDLGCKTYILDGDNVRMGLNNDLGFKPHERKENIRRVGEASALFADSGIIVISAFISPYSEDRLQARKACTHDFIEVHVDCDLSSCESRDPKGLYKKARAGLLPDFTGIDSPYEKPVNPEVLVKTNEDNAFECVDQILRCLEKRKIIPSVLGKINTLDKNKTIAIDFDGVVHAYSRGFEGLENVYDDVHPGARSAIASLNKAGYKLIIMSSRPAYVIRSWLKKHALDSYFNDVTNIKRPASFYIDDHAIEFKKGSEDSWTSALDKILK